MKKAFKIFLTIVVVCVVAVIAAGVLILLLVDPNDYKDEIASVVKDKTGRDLVIEGKIGLSVFPWLGLELGPTQLSNARGFGKEPFAKISNATIRVKLLPLLKQRVEMDKLIIEGLELNLVRNKAGRTNWQGLAKPSSVSAKPPKAKVKKSAAPGLAGLALGGVRVSDARIQWIDQKKNERYSVENLNLTIGSIRSERPFDLKLGFDLKGMKDMEGQVSFASAISLDSAVQRIRLDKTDLKVQIKGKGLPPKGIEARLRSTVFLDLVKQTLDLSTINLRALGMELEGRINGRSILNAPKITGLLKVGQFSPRELLEALGQEDPSTSDSSALTKASLELSLKATSNSIKVEKLEGRLDSTAINGALGITGFSQPAIRFKLVLDTIDLDRYLPPSNKKQERKSTTKAVAIKKDTAGLPALALGALNLKGSLRIGKMKAQNLTVRDIRVRVNARNGNLEIKPVTAKLYNGSFGGKIRLLAPGSKPRLSMDQKLSDVQVGPLLKDLLGAERVSGGTNLRANITAMGLTGESIRKTMSGDVSFVLTDGAFHGINITHEVCKAWAVFKRKPAPSDDVENKTIFTKFTGTARITKGLIRNEDLHLISSVMQSTGSGTVNLVNERINYLIKTVFEKPIQCPNGETIKKLRKVILPIRIKGKLSKPKYRLDLNAVLTEKLKSKVEKKIKKKLGKDIFEKIQKGLEGLFR